MKESVRAAPSMYVPKHFAHDDRADLLAVMREHSFATLVSIIDAEPFATHVPVLVREERGGALVIEGHVAAANPHARSLAAGGRALTIFHGPHTYVSPSHYRSEGRVPTWNYIAVHASGTARAIDDAEGKLAILGHLIAHHDPDFAPRFAAFDARQRDGLLAAITGFEIAIDKLEGKFKLGQHRLADDLPSLQASHESGSEDERAIAQWMRRLGYWK